MASAIDDLEDIDLDRYPTLPLLRRACQLRRTITAFDATYVALAEERAAVYDVTVADRHTEWCGPAAMSKTVTNAARFPSAPSMSGPTSAQLRVGLPFTKDSRAVHSARTPPLA